ncbi:MAG: YbaN family protein [Pseudomonadota bacterium]|nr:YbaN family protein [Pseudomonadota bacterium]MDP1906495.1 YbaN family protein [Pseudomonadota bacterium]MDP2351937.1 YbaN family protein [Pseudomonadota bacterium]
MSGARLHDSRWVRLLCLGMGIAALLLGIVGILLPLLPTTPFILLAAACFARSSLRFHDWLLNQRIAGPIIREWQTHRAMPRRAKRAAYLLMLLSFGSSILFLDLLWHRLMLAALGLILGFFLWRVPVRELPETDDEAARST